MAVTDQVDTMQIARDESNPFGDEQENIFAHHLQKFNESLEALGTDMQSNSSSKLRKDSLLPTNAPGRVKSEDLLAEADLSLFADASRSLGIDPNAMNANSAQAGLASSMYSNKSLWSGQSKLTLPSATHVRNSIAQFGQFTPPNDGPSELSMYDREIGHNGSLQLSIEDGGAEDASSSHPSPTSVQEDETKVKSKSGSAQSRKRRRKSYKADTPEEDQKREEFLARNRVAASKSRQKKKEWTQSLEQRLKGLQDENQHLTYAVTHLRDEIIAMKTMCLSHVECDCDKIRDYMSRTLEIGGGLGRRLPALSTAAPSNQPAGIVRDDAAMFPGRFSAQSMLNFPSASQSPSSDRQPSIFDMSSPPTNDRSRSRLNSSATMTSSIHPPHETANMKMEDSPFSRQDALESPEELALTFDDDLNDPKDIDMSAMWEETVGGGDYITGTAV